MTTMRKFPLILLAAAALAACSSVPADNAQLDHARSAYAAAQGDGRTATLAPVEFRQSAAALALAEAAYARGDGAARVDQLAYLAGQRVATAQQIALRKDAEARIAQAGAARDAMRLAARTREADDATAAAHEAQDDAAHAQRQSESAQRQAVAAQRDAQASQQLAQASQQQAGDAEQRNRMLESQLRDLNAKQTERGMVVTIGDLLFDTDRAQLKPGGRQPIERLGAFLQQYPRRKARIEGYTDSTGSASHNLALSGRRADAVRAALVDLGVNPVQLSAQGYGESNPVAGNESSGGRQMNRRVEVVLSNDEGDIGKR
ncbi:MAG: OmpA family protein [Burkholderiales bacterium]|nr:OmpA family protein [Burkholderiales bacterium]MDE1928506.1 OmpA family protein [Burkholderiales bacterium]MDE2161165.1 OmpA family protein [Burkholderiales bacterium]MDE2504377.1 OmpA family protein [Burkholderiales bacterium]